MSIKFGRKSKQRKEKFIPPLIIWQEIEKKIEVAGKHVRSNILKQNVKGGIRARRMLRNIRIQLKTLIDTMLEVDKQTTETRKVMRKENNPQKKNS